MSQDFKTKHWFSLNEEYPLTWDELPERIRLSNGNTKTNKETFTEEDLKDVGYAFIDIFPNYNDETHKCVWNKTEWKLIELSDREKYIIRPDLAPKDDSPILNSHDDAPD